MGNLSSAIIEARKRHEAEIAERLKRRQQRQRAEIERLNATAAETSAPAAEATAERALPAAEPDAPRPTEPAVEQPPVAWSSAPKLLEPPDLAPPIQAVEPPPAPVADLTPARLAATVEPDPQPPAAGRPTPAPQPPPTADEVETLPDGRFMRLRNEIIDRIKPYLTGNQFAVYLEIYRQTVGRGKTSGWFRTRDIQTACNLGSDNTVRDAYPVLEQKRLIRLDPNRRAGSPKGLHITVLSVERALDRLERAPAQAPRPAVALASVAQSPLLEDVDAPSSDGDLTLTLTRQYGVSPTVAPQLLDLIGQGDRELLPYLFARLDRSIASGKVHNPAGLLRVWLESFDAWRIELEADRRRDEEARNRAREAASRDELMVEWFRETEARVQERLEALAPEALADIKQRGRAELLTRSPAVRTWTDAQWESQLETYVKGEIRRGLETFDAWLSRTGRG